MSLADVLGWLSRELLGGHTYDEAIRGGVHDAPESPQVLREEQPAPPAGPRDAEGVECKTDVHQVKSVHVLVLSTATAATTSMMALSFPHALQVDEQGAQRVHLGVDARV